MCLTYSIHLRTMTTSKTTGFVLFNYIIMLCIYSLTLSPH